MKVKIKKLSDKAVLPIYTKNGDAGMDVTAISKTVVDKGNYGYIEYGTGLAFQLEEGYYIDIRPRSSISNTGMILSNAPGTLDENYIGELKVRFKWIPDTVQYEVGERIAQIMVKKYETVEWEEVNELTETNRGDAGFGSTGN
jgi:dUTP pyrophosphatase